MLRNVALASVLSLIGGAAASPHELFERAGACNRDNLLRCFVDARYSTQASAYCAQLTPYTTTVATVTATETVTESQTTTASTETETVSSVTTVFTATVPSATVTVTRSAQQPVRMRRDEPAAAAPKCMTSGVTYADARITSACSCIDVPASTVSTTYTAGTQTVTATNIASVTATATVTEWSTVSTVTTDGISTVTVDPPAPTNLIINPGFEGGLDPWTFYNNDGSSWAGSVVRIAGHNGQGTAAMAITNTRDKGYSVLRSNYFTLEAGRRYSYRFITRNTAERDPKHYLTVTITSDGEGVLEISPTGGQAIGNDWTRYSGEFVVAANRAGNKGQFSINLMRNQGKSITWYFDDVVVIEVA
ncbi:Galactose-binding domain-like protein [Tolypocladium paradoxum]|uniref:Galactose-binding domain-like protein n=1 Tax=Tolypocladium paradoxum TaxID=94208 RepID=A0A2S4KL83_9HYPO|nr:Galactose-binding domain-like protein [Tolypocladium paradoxum]